VRSKNSLGGENDLVPSLTYGLGDDIFCAVCRTKVDEIDAVIETVLDKPHDAVDRPAASETQPALAAGSESHDAYAQTCPPKRRKLHLMFAAQVAPFAQRVTGGTSHAPSNSVTKPL
jgi:hypothetical protein